MVDEENLISLAKDVRQGKLFQRCTHFLYFSVLSLGSKVNTRLGVSQPDMGSIFQIKNQWNILVKGKYYANYQNYPNLMLLSSSDTRGTLKHLFLFTNTAPRENWFQYVRRENATAVNFPYIIALRLSVVQRFLHFHITLFIWNPLMPGCEARVDRVTIFLTFSPTLTPTEFLNPDISPFRTCHICQ